MARRALPIFAAMIFAAGAARAGTIEMAYPEEQGIEQGPGHFAFNFLRAAEMVIQDSGLAVHWVALPNPRATHRLALLEENFCIVGAGVLAERRDLGKFTSPFLVSRMLGVMALKSHRDDLERARSLTELIRRTQSDFLAYTSFNYGDQITPGLEWLRKQGRLSDVAHTTGQILDMLKAGRADYALVSQAYGTNYLAARSDGGDFVLRSYPDMHRDYQLAFLCSKAVPDSVIATLDQAIQRQATAIQARFPDQAK
jgi:hypothetical protein